MYPMFSVKMAGVKQRPKGCLAQDFDSSTTLLGAGARHGIKSIECFLRGFVDGV